METTILLAQLNAAPGADEEFNRWYEEEHLSDILSIPHVHGASRFQVSDASARNEQAPWKYLTIYTVERGMEDRVTAEIRRRVANGQIVMNPAMAPAGQSWFFDQISSRVAGQNEHRNERRKS